MNRAYADIKAVTLSLAGFAALWRLGTVARKG